jgi:hypothetical protein
MPASILEFIVFKDSARHRDSKFIRGFSQVVSTRYRDEPTGLVYYVCQYYNQSTGAEHGGCKRQFPANFLKAIECILAGDERIRNWRRMHYIEETMRLDL